ncbi:MAG: NAD+ synthase [Opitutales bacterium]|nr:NAD+ synthase [Opitutales bacterium]
MKVGLAQINTVVGDLEGNAAKVAETYARLVADGAELVVFPELVITGYPPRDLLFKRRFVGDAQAALARVAAETGDVPALIGCVEVNEARQGRRFWNAAFWCERGRVRGVARKCLLPTYDVFDEDRYFESAADPAIFTHAGRRIGVTICEDIWTGPVVETSRHYLTDPVGRLAEAGVDLVVNLSASPWHYGKDSTRLAIVGGAAQRVGCPLVYVNAIGGNDELIFDGHSMVLGADGTVSAGLGGFAEATAVVDPFSAGDPQTHPRFFADELADIHDALVLGLRDYARKSGFRSALVGLSGGIDSALTAALAKEALGAENVLGVSLPSAISSQHSRDDAAALARNLGIRYETLPIAEVVAAAESTLAPLFVGRPRDVTEENIQARARGLLLMALSNKTGALLLTTGNKSEIAVGYCTLYGDMAGGLAVISDLPKTKVFELCRWLNRDREIIPWNTITKPPSAELRPDQKDEDSLPPYDVLDAILHLYVEQGEGTADIVARGFNEAVVRDVVRKVDLNEYKRKQAAPGLKITPLAFGVGRRIPIVQKYVSS